MDKLKYLFTGNGASEFPVNHFNSGKIFSIKEEEEMEMDFLYTYKKEFGYWQKKGPQSKHKKIVSCLYIYQTKFAIIPHLETLNQDFWIFQHHKPPYEFDMFMVFQIRKWLINIIQNPDNIYELRKFDLMGFFDEGIILRDVLIPFFSRPTDEVVKTTPEQWEAVITEIKLLML